MSAIYTIPQAQGSSSAIALLDYVKPDLELIEQRLNSEITSAVKMVYSIGGHVLSAGGKRLRPALVALSARAIDPDMVSDRIVRIGASVELVHMATLVHDDVVDATTTRRGKPTANAVFGNGVAVLTGDFLLARAMHLLSEDADMRVMRTATEITVEMSEGEVLEILATGNPDIHIDEYYDILRKKTAVFLEGCCRCGAALANAPEDQECALGTYGVHIGMAFQIADDLLDYTGDPALTGKPVGSDLRSGRATLPFLFALADMSLTARVKLLQAFGDPDLNECEVAEIVGLFEEQGVFERTREVATDHVDKANTALAMLPPSSSRDCLHSLSDYVVHRDR